MAKRIILAPLIKLLSFPLIKLSRIGFIFNCGNLEVDIESCLKLIGSLTDEIPSNFIWALIAAEDHRSAMHAGVDPIGILRALFIQIIRKQTQGASTIEQQFVRVVSGRYDQSLRRKFREQIVAIELGRLRTKREIASAYLSIAFYGSEFIGLEGLRKHCGVELKMSQSPAYFEMIAQLKYPRPLDPSIEWRNKIQKRVRYIENRLVKYKLSGEENFT